MPVALLLALALTAPVARATPEPLRPVVFVCEHGNVKSLIAQQWFNALARQRGTDLRAVSRGVTPESGVPPRIADALAKDGFDVSGFESQRLSAQDVAAAKRVIAIGVDLTSFALGDARVARWDGIPPASTNYMESRDALKARIRALLDTLEGQKNQ